MKTILRTKLNFLKQRLVNQQKDRYGLKKGLFTLSQKNSLKKKLKAELKTSRRYIVAKTYEIPRGRLKIKKLTLIVKNHSGRNNTGKITVRHKGGRHKRFYRMLNYKHFLEGPARVVKINYDPNRTGFIALLLFPSGLMTYVLCAENIKLGQKLLISKGFSYRTRRLKMLDKLIKNRSFINYKELTLQRTERGERGPKGERGLLRIKEHLGLDDGNILPLRYIPLGSFVFNISKHVNSQPIYGRSAGVYLKLVTKKLQRNSIGYAGLVLPSGKSVYVDLDCLATFGRVSNSDHHLRKLHKAGQNRWRGIRPSVRGVAMNPVDHPMGGGEGKTSGGRPSVSAWGRLTKGFKTRKKIIIKKEKALQRRRNQLKNYKIEFKKPLKQTYYFQRNYFKHRTVQQFNNIKVEKFIKMYQKNNRSSVVLDKTAVNKLYSISK